MKQLFIIALGLSIVACAPEPEKEVKDLNDILPSAERDYEKEEPKETDSEDTLKRYQNRFNQLGTLDSISVYDQDLFPDRVGPKGVEKYRLSIGEEGIVFVKWTFSDSTRVTNALFNWADCFGPKCKFIRIGEEKNLQPNAFHILANDTTLIYLESETKLDTKKWDDYFDEQGYEQDWNYRLEQIRYGRVRWFEYIDEKKIQVKEDTL